MKQLILGAGTHRKEIVTSAVDIQGIKFPTSVKRSDTLWLFNDEDTRSCLRVPVIVYEAENYEELRKIAHGHIDNLIDAGIALDMGWEK